MPKIRAEEVWARACIAAALEHVEVIHHDDGSSDGMYDLEVRTGGRVAAAVEVTSVLDAPTTVLWDLLTGGGRWIEKDLAGGWIVALRPNANAKQLKAELPAFLRRLEEAGVRGVPIRTWQPGLFEQEAVRLGITHLSQRGTSYPGSIYASRLAVAGARSGGIAVGECRRAGTARDTKHTTARRAAGRRSYPPTDLGLQDRGYILHRRRARLPDVDLAGACRCERRYPRLLVISQPTGRTLALYEDQPARPGFASTRSGKPLPSPLTGVRQPFAVFAARKWAVRKPSIRASSRIDRM